MRATAAVAALAWLGGGCGASSTGPAHSAEPQVPPAPAASVEPEVPADPASPERSDAIEIAEGLLKSVIIGLAPADELTSLRVIVALDAGDASAENYVRGWEEWDAGDRHRFVTGERSVVLMGRKTTSKWTERSDLDATRERREVAAVTLSPTRFVVAESTGPKSGAPLFEAMCAGLTDDTTPSSARSFSFSMLRMRVPPSLGLTSFGSTDTRSPLQLRASVVSADSARLTRDTEANELALLGGIARNRKRAEGTGTWRLTELALEPEATDSKLIQVDGHARGAAPIDDAAWLRLVESFATIARRTRPEASR